MGELLLMTGWTFAVGYAAYWIGVSSRAELIKKLTRDNYYLRRHCDQLARANTELDLDLELERIRNV
jgi:hypothetical protein